MVDINKLQELVENGVGSKAARKAQPRPKDDALAAAAMVKRGMGEIQKVSDNVFVCVGGISGTAVRGGLIDVVGVECMPRGKWGTTPSSKFIGQDFPSARDSYLKLTAMMQRHAEQNALDYVTVATGMTLMAPLKVGADRASQPLVAYMFADFGAHGDRRDYMPCKSGTMPRPRFHRPVFKACFSNLIAQIRNNAELQALGRPVRVGLPRLYGAIGGISFMQLVELITKGAEEAAGIEFYIFSSKTPDAALVCPTDIHRRAPNNKRARSNAGNARKPRPAQGVANGK